VIYSVEDYGQGVTISKWSVSDIMTAIIFFPPVCPMENLYQWGIALDNISFFILGIKSII